MKSRTSPTRSLESQLATCMIVDRMSIRHQMQALRHQQRGRSLENTPDWQALVRRIAVSQACYTQRQQRLPQPELSQSLPIAQKQAEIMDSLSQHQVVVVCGETGSGKTTQLPQICLAMGRGVAGMIGHTQPRRVAARTVAHRIAQELDSELGDWVGYQVRFHEQTSIRNYIKVMTDGVLLAETQTDRYLDAYDTIIVDEAHERSLNIDFLLGYLKQLLPKRPDLKIIVTSATIDVVRFSQFFDQAPVIEVSGRMYPVELWYRPIQDKKEGDDAAEESLEQTIAEVVHELIRADDGDILVFLPGEREIRDVADNLAGKRWCTLEILPLFGRLSMEEQQKIFRQTTLRRVVLATNVAETSLTVPGIKYVIDSGLARVSRYSPRSRIERLQVEKISQASANQRAGRCGRVSDGICVRLYSEQDFQQRPEFTDPEILRSSLASVILRMAVLRLGAVEQFPFIEPPHFRLIADGYQLLHELGAVDTQRRVTACGRQLVKLPLDLRLGRMILAAHEQHCVMEVIVIAAVLAMQDPRERFFDQREVADKAHAQFADACSDFMSDLHLWHAYQQQVCAGQSRRILMQYCRKHFLSYLRMKEWQALQLQLLGIAREIKLSINTQPASHDQIHKAILAGLIGNIGFQDGVQEAYLGARGLRFNIFPGSALKSRPKWVMVAELMETSKLYAHHVAQIDPRWIEPIAKARGLTVSQYADPVWDTKSAQVLAYQRVTLYGLTIVARRQVYYGHINPTQSREIFIREGLVHEQFQCQKEFLHANRQLIREVEQLEHKSRRQDVLVDLQAIYDFYDARIPPEVVDGASFERWYHQQSAPDCLRLERQDIMLHTAETVTEDLFPECVQWGDLEMALKYRFEPGHILDGVLAIIPLHCLTRINWTYSEWLVPGMIRDKITWLLKSLPKTLRRACVPIPDFVTAFLQQADSQTGGLYEQLRQFIAQQTGQEVTGNIWSEQIPEHFLMSFRLVDAHGRELDIARDGSLLVERYGQMARFALQQAAQGVERDGIREWNFGDLPEEVTLQISGKMLTVYPALAVSGDSVAIRVFETQSAAQKSHRDGLHLLLSLALESQLKKSDVTKWHADTLSILTVVRPDNLRKQILSVAIASSLGNSLPRTQADFMSLRRQIRVQLPQVMADLLQIIQAVGQQYQQVLQKLAVVRDTALRNSLTEQLAQLLPEQFLSLTPWEYLQHLPRYLQAMVVRMDKFQPQRDARHMSVIQPLLVRWQAAMQQQSTMGMENMELIRYRWLIEELRVSLFAQELKTPFPVSDKRLEEAWNRIQKMGRVARS